MDLIDACGCPVIAKPFDLTELLGVLTALAGKKKEARA
jgi:hypothetical protein